MAIVESPRINYQRVLAKGRIVNIGCGSDPVGFGENAVHVDLDVYNYKNFVKADAHNLPFKDEEFDTAVLGDILEHSPDPVKMLKEAARVAKVIIVTIYEEKRIPENIKEALIQFDEGVKKIGFNTYYDYLKSLPDHKDVIVSVTPDTVIPHHAHIQAFTEDKLQKIIEDAELDIVIFKKFVEGIIDGKEQYNWLLVAKRKK